MISDDPNHLEENDLEWTSGGTLVERLENAAGQNNSDSSNEPQLDKPFDDLVLKEWQDHTFSILKPANKFARYFIGDFPNWLNSTLANRVEISPVGNKPREIDLIIGGHWTARIVVNTENPVRVYLEISKIQDGDTFLPKKLSGQVDFRKAGEYMQKLGPSVYCFALIGNQDYEVLKETLLQIREFQASGSDTSFEISSEQNNASIKEIDEPVVAPNNSKVSLKDWQDQSAASLKTTNDFVNHLVFNFPDWLQLTFGDRIEIDHSKKNGLEIWLNKQWAARVYFNVENPAYVYLNLIAVQDDITNIHQSLSGQAEFKRGPANMQTTSRKVYTFWVGKAQDYDVLKQALVRIADRVQLPWSVPNVGREKILEVMEKFDLEERTDKSYPNGWYNWENSTRVTSGKYKYAIRYKGQLYPPRHIFNMAAGGKQDYTTDVARRYLTNIGFELITLDSPAKNLWPSQVDGPCYVLMHQHEDERQHYGETYSFELRETGGRKDLYDALQAQKAGISPVFALIYLPGNHPLTGQPHKAFTAWARVKDWEPATDGETTHIIVRLEHHDFPVPLYVQGNAADLTEKLDWLRNDLSKTFWQRSIRKISDTDFKSIIEAARQAAGEEMGLADAAYAVLFEAPGPVALADITEQMVKLGLINRPPQATELANTLMDDSDRFMSVGEGRWTLLDRNLEPALPEGFDHLEDYWNFVYKLQPGQGYTIEELYQSAVGINPETNLESFVMGLRQLRLVRFNPATARYELQPHATSEGNISDKSAILGIMTLGLLLPERADEKFNLAAREILPRMQKANGPQPATDFAPELKWENEKLLSWYAEAGLVDYNPVQGKWKMAGWTVVEMPGASQAIRAYNRLVNSLRQLYLEQAVSQAESFGPLSQVKDFEAKLKELQKSVLVDDRTVLRVYRSLLAGRHVILSGPPGTGKSLLAEKLPEILWRQEHHAVLPGTDLDGDLLLDRSETIHGYRAIFVTATEDWSVRDVIGGISPRLGGSEGDGKMTYDIRYGALTGTVLKNYKFTEEGKKLPVDAARPQRDYLNEGDKRYLGAWLVIDEFNRAHIDAAFGSLLTTLSGKSGATLAVPARGSDVTELRMPDDFRIIGTLNSFDRHFLNQVSEALKRRFDFIDILPPRPERYGLELVISIQGALKRLHRNGFPQVRINSDGYYFWPQVIEIILDQGLLEPFYEDSAAEAALRDFQQIFSVIRFFRKLGTAQVEAVLTNLFTGVLVGMSWPEALDLALADTLADQLQILTSDEQLILESYLTYAGDPVSFAKAVQEQLPGHKARRGRVVSLLREADILHNGTSTIEPQIENHPTADQLTGLFKAGQALGLLDGYFLRRLRDLNTDRGI